MTKLKIYIASAIKYKNDVEVLVAWLQTNFDVEITRDWWTNYKTEASKMEDLSDHQYYASPINRAIDQLDVMAIEEATIFIILGKDLNGALIELGVALTLNKLCLSFGQHNRTAMRTRSILVDDYIQLKNIINLAIYGGG